MEKDEIIYKLSLFVLYLTGMQVLLRLYGIDIVIIFGLATLIMNTSD